MRRPFAIFLVLLSACVRHKEPMPPGMSTPDGEKRNEIKAPPAVVTITNLSGPESALYDPDQDVYFISNINGGLLDRDNGGFITRVDAKTMKVDLEWIEGGRNNVKLDAAKGMAVAGDSLYVSDTEAVRKFDRRTGAPQGAIALPGSTTINDLTSDGRKIYVSDTAVVPASGETFGGTGTDAIWMIENDQAKKIAGGRDLHQPNGLAFVNGKLWVVTFGGDELYQLDGGKKSSVTTLPREQLDGVVGLADGTFFVTSWKGACVYRGKAGRSFEPLLQAIPTPADIGYDSKRHLLLVPSSAQNQVTLHPVQ